MFTCQEFKNGYFARLFQHQNFKSYILVIDCEDINTEIASMTANSIDELIEMTSNQVHLSGVEAESLRDFLAENM